MRRNSGFTMTELLVVVAVIVILAALLIPTLSHSRDTAYRVACLHQIGQISLASSMYALDNSGFLPPHEPSSKWPSQLQPAIHDPRVLLCPVDLLELNSSPTNFTSPFDALPRSYLMNGFYDVFKSGMSAADFALLQKGLKFAALNEADIANPSSTLIFGEKADTNVFYLNVTEPNVAFLNDLSEARHGLQNRNGTFAGANYGMADGAVMFIPYGGDTSPLNMWGGTPACRTDATICRPRVGP